MTAQVGGDVNPFTASVAVYQQAASLSGNLNFNAVAKVCCKRFSQIYVGKSQHLFIMVQSSLGCTANVTFSLSSC
jgi:hypothetical protein